MWFRKKIEIGKDEKLSTAQLGEKVLGNTNSGTGKSFLNKEWWYSKVMDWSMKSTDFKTKMFRFVDVFPYLNSGDDLLKHVDEYFKDEKGDLPSLFSFGSTVGQMAPNFVSKSVEKNIKDMARLFITGDSPEDAIEKLNEARKNNLGFTVDLLGELTLSEKEAEDYKNRYLNLIKTLHKQSSSWSENILIDKDHLGSIPIVNVSVKVSSLYSQIKLEAWEQTKIELVERIKPIFRRAKELGVFINIDMEHYQYKALTLEVFEDLIMDDEFKEYPHWGIVLQAYLKDSFKDCEKLISLAQKRTVPFTVRLVKGAYWDHEVILAKQNHWPIPVYTTKENSDYNFEKCAKLLLTHYKDIRVALGSHNLRSICESLVFARSKGIPKQAFEIQMLFGMAEHFKKSFTDLGYRVREYATIGELVPGMAYLVRRLLENSSNQSFLQSKMKTTDSVSTLLAPPRWTAESKESNDDSKDLFKNAPLLDFTIKQHREKFQKELDMWTKLFVKPQQVAPVVNGEERITSKKIPRSNPNENSQILYEISNPSEDIVEKALTIAFDHQKIWSKTKHKNRVRLIEKVADLIEENRYKLASLQTIEVGKPWAEADGDITEAIDFCRYYARDMKSLGVPFKIGHAPGEESLYHYHPRGVVGVIAPWNFPLAILCGMTVSALVTGNCVLIKPAEQSSYIAQEFYKILMKAGVSPQVCHFLPGEGETVGKQIVESPKVSVISFTGSKAVGLQIINKVSEVKPGQRHVKKAIVEMGGKNPLIIDSDADLDQAVSGALYSAFAFSGQKCSALSRVLVLEPIYERFCTRLEEAVKSLEVGESTFPKVYSGPVVDEESYARIQSVIEENKALYRSVSSENMLTEKKGNFVTPHVFFDVDPWSDLATKEIFGPVLAVIKVPDIDTAIKIMNDSEYALTAGIYSRLPSNIDKARENIECGNLYINRSITGAMVERHPFGGFKLSGLGSKTGGPDYLKNFMEPRVMTENLVRQGFSPDLL